MPTSPREKQSHKKKLRRGPPSAKASPKKATRKTRIDYHRDGSIRAKGLMRGGTLDGCWEWYRRDHKVTRF